MIDLVAKNYRLNFSEKEWEEIRNLGFEPFFPEPRQPLTREQWLAVADLALGKAQRIEDGYDHFDDGLDEASWVEELRAIAKKILNWFRPGDGQL